jgi:hypothetical protein
MLARTKLFPVFAAWALLSLLLNAAASAFAPAQVSISSDLHSAPHKALKSHSTGLRLESTPFIAEDTDDPLLETLNRHNRDKIPCAVANCPAAIAAAPISLGPPRKSPIAKIPRYLFISVLNL